MFLPDQKTIRQILEELSDIYPGRTTSRELLLDNDDRKDVVRHLAYCNEEGLIEAKEGQKDDCHAPVELIFLKITSAGLNELRKESER